MSSNIVVTNCLIQSNENRGIFVEGGSTLKISGSKIEKNGESDFSDDQLRICNSTLFMENTTVSNSVGGSGIYFNNSKSELTNCLIQNNKYYGIYVDKKSSIIILKCKVKSNLRGSINEYGGFFSSNNVVIKDSEIDRFIYL